MSLFAHRSYKPDEQLDPIDAEMIRLGRARLKLQDDGSFLLVDSADLNGTTLAAEVMRMKIAKQLEHASRGGDRHDRMLKAVAYSRQLAAEGTQLTEARTIAALKFGFENGNSVRNAEAHLQKKRIG